MSFGTRRQGRRGGFQDPAGVGREAGLENLEGKSRSVDLDVLELCVVWEGGGQDVERGRQQAEASLVRRVRPEEESLEQNGRERRSTGVESGREGGLSEFEPGCDNGPDEGWSRAKRSEDSSTRRERRRD